MKISEIVTWHVGMAPDGSIEYIGTVKVSAMTVVARYVKDDPTCIARAKRIVVEGIYREMYYDLDRQLYDLERSIWAHLPVGYNSQDPDGPLAKVRAIQAALAERR